MPLPATRIGLRVSTEPVPPAGVRRDPVLDARSRPRALNSASMTTTPSTPLGTAQVELITGRVSIIVASRNAQLRPHLMRAVGCRLAGDYGRVTVLLPEAGGREVLADLRENRQIAVVFSRPSTNQTVQLKGDDATVGPCGPADKALADQYLQGFIEEIGQLGHAAEVAHTILGHDRGLTAVHFTVAAAFEQTPGPAAGQPLAPAARNVA